MSLLTLSSKRSILNNAPTAVNIAMSADASKIIVSIDDGNAGVNRGGKTTIWGSSTAEGTGATTVAQQAFNGHVQNHILSHYKDMAWANIAQGGLDSANYRLTANGGSPGRNVDMGIAGGAHEDTTIAIINNPSNDTFSGISPADHITNLEEWHDQLAADGVPVIIMNGTQPRNISLSQREELANLSDPTPPASFNGGVSLATRFATDGSRRWFVNNYGELVQGGPAASEVGSPGFTGQIATTPVNLDFDGAHLNDAGHLILGTNNILALDEGVRANSDTTNFLIERQVDSGPWTAVPGVSTKYPYTIFEDSSFPVGAVVRYRVASMINNDRSAYTVSNALNTEPSILVNTASIDFGQRNTPAGPTPNQNILIDNVSDAADLDITSVVSLIGADPGEFNIVSDTGEDPITPGGRRTVSVNFDPSTVGVKNASLQIRSNDPQTPNSDVALTGEGISTSGPEINVTPLTFDFGNVGNGVPVTTVISIQNVGTSNLDITSIALTTGTVFTISADSGEDPITPGQIREVTVQFTPSDSSSVFNDTLVIQSDDADEGTVNVSLTGTGELSQKDRSFVNSSGDTIYYLEYLPPEYYQNPTKDFPVMFFLHGSGKKAPANTNQLYELRGDANLPPGKAENGTMNHPLIIISPQLQDGNGNWRSSYTDEVYEEVITTNPNSLRLDANRLYITGFSLGGHGTWDHAQDFPSKWIAYAPGHSVGGYQSGKRCDPANNGASGWIYDGANDGTSTDTNNINAFQSIRDNCSAVGRVVENGVETVAGGDPELFFNEDAGLGHSAVNMYALDNTYNTPNLYEWFLSKSKLGAREISVTPGGLSINFGQRIVTDGPTAEQEVTITNVGGANLNISSVALTTGTEFSITDDTGESVLWRNDVRTIKLVFDPTSNGIKNDTLVIQSDDSDEGTVNVALTGEGTTASIPDIDVSPTSHDFGDQGVTLGATAAQNFTIQNLGSANLNISSVTLLTGTEYAISSDTGETVLAPLATRTVGVTFDPTSAGTKNDTLRIDSDDPDEDPLDVSLTGNGIAEPVVRYNFGTSSQPSQSGYINMEPPPDPEETAGNDVDYGSQDAWGHTVIALNKSVTGGSWGWASQNVGGSGNLGSTTGSDSGIFPDNCLTEYWFGQHPNVPGIRFGGHIAGNTYTVRGTGSRSGSGTRVCQFEIIDPNTTHTDSFDVQPNTSVEFNFTGVEADSNGDITLNISSLSTTFVYLNVIEITPE